MLLLVSIHYCEYKRRVPPRLHHIYKLTIRLVGTLVLAKTMAPMFFSAFTTHDSVSSVSALPSHATYPTDVSASFTRNWSFSEIGKPWRGPTGFPWTRRYSSSSCARASACENRTSLRQLTCHERQHQAHIFPARAPWNHQLMGNGSTVAEGPGNVCRGQSA